MPGTADFVVAFLIAPACAGLALAAGMLTAVIGGGSLDDAAILGGLTAFVLLPPATIVLRARVRRLALGWACLLLCMTLVAMLATVVAIALVMSFVYAWFMRGF